MTTTTQNQGDPKENAQIPDQVHVHGPECSHGDHSHHHEVLSPIKRANPKIGRNDPCPCGSGKKFKKCHGE